MFLYDQAHDGRVTAQRCSVHALHSLAGSRVEQSFSSELSKVAGPSWSMNDTICSKLHPRDWAHLHRQWPLASWAAGHSPALVRLGAARALGIGMLLAAGVSVAPAPAIDGHDLQPVSHTGLLRVHPFQAL